MFLLLSIVFLKKVSQFIGFLSNFFIDFFGGFGWGAFSHLLWSLGGVHRRAFRLLFYTFRVIVGGGAIDVFSAKRIIRPKGRADLQRSICKVS